MGYQQPVKPSAGASVLNNYAATTAPSDSNDTTEGYSVGSVWVDTSGGERYVCLDASEASAVWALSTAGTASEIVFTPAGDLAATEVQTALEELDMEKAPALVADENYVTDAEKTKLGHITVTQAVDLDALETAVAALDQATILKGSWDASAGTFPGSGAAQAGWSYIVSVAGTVDGTAFAINDRIIAILDNASTSTFASNWFKADYTDQVLSVAGNTGAVTQDQITGLSSTGIVKRTAANTLGVATADTDYVTPTGTVTLTNKTLTKPVHNGSVQGINAATDDTTITFDCAAANIHSVTLGGNRTLALSNTTAGQCIMLELKQDGTGSRTVTWFSGISWAGGSAPTLTTTAAKTDVIGIRVVTAGSAYYGYVVGQNI